MAFDWGNAFRGGASGAAAGSMISPGWGTAIGGGLGAFGGLFGGGGEDEHKTNQLLDQIPDQLKQYLMPYLNEYQQNLSDPNAIINKIGSGYKESPGYQWRLNQGENAIDNAAARGGMAGTAQHQQQAGELAGNLANQDYWDFVNKGLGVYGGSLSGGASAAGGLGESLANLLQGKAGMNFQRGQANNKMNSDLMSSILAMLSKNQNKSIWDE